MKTLISGLLLSVVCSLAVADNESWVPVASIKSTGTEFSIKKGSGELLQNKAGESIYVVVGRDHSKKDSRVELQKWYVRAQDCQSKQGQLVSLSLKGEFLFENDFVFNAGSVASTIAEAICGAFEYNLKQQAEEEDKKGI